MPKKTSQVRGVSVLIEASNSLGPAEIQLLPYGWQHTHKGTWLVDDQALSQIMADRAVRTNDLVVDYEHQTDVGSIKAPAAGWLKRFINRGRDGLWARVAWTKRAEGYIKNKEYRYISPVIIVDEQDHRVTKVLRAALTNAPLIDGMAPLTNKGTMPKENAMKKKLTAMFGLSEDVSDEELIQTILAKTTPSTGQQQTSITSNGKIEVPEICGLLELDPQATAPEVIAKIQKLKQNENQSAVLAAKVASLEKAAKSREASELVEIALKDGKITPAQKEWAEGYARRDPDGFRSFSAKAPQIVPLDQVAAKDTQQNEDKEIRLGKQIAGTWNGPKENK